MISFTHTHKQQRVEKRRRKKTIYCLTALIDFNVFWGECLFRSTDAHAHTQWDINRNPASLQRRNRSKTFSIHVRQWFRLSEVYLFFNASITFKHIQIEWKDWDWCCCCCCCFYQEKRPKIKKSFRNFKAYVKFNVNYPNEGKDSECTVWSLSQY